MIVAARFLRDRRRADLGWAAGILAVVVLTALLWPSIEGSASFDEVIDDLPDTVQVMIGAHGGISLGTPAGYLNARIFATVLPVLLTVYAIGLGARAVAGSEEDGTLELLLANPVSRRRVAVERGLTAAASVVALGAVGFAGIVVLGAPVGLLAGVSLPRLLAACAGVAVLALLHGAVAFAAGAATGRRGVAVGAATVVAVAGYLVAGLLATAPDLARLRAISPWEWLLARNVLVAGTPPVPLLVELALGGLAAVLGGRRFEQRDLR